MGIGCCEGLVDVHDGQPHSMGMRVDSAPQANGRLVGHAVEPRFSARHSHTHGTRWLVQPERDTFRYEASEIPVEGG